MSLHKTLKSKSTLVRHRNVLNRAERVGRLKEEEKWGEGRDVFGLPKVAHRKAVVGGKTKKEEKPTEEGAAVAATEAGKPEAAAGAKPGAKGGGAKPDAKAAAAKPAAKPGGKAGGKAGGK